MVSKNFRGKLRNLVRGQSEQRENAAVAVAVTAAAAAIAASRIEIERLKGDVCCSKRKGER